MNTIKIKRALGTLTISEEKISDLLDNLPILESILLMYKTNKDTFENQWEVEFPKAESDEFLLNYFLKHSSYSKDYIKRIFTNN